jgi:hypothetical protein
VPVFFSRRIIAFWAAIVCIAGVLKPAHTTMMRATIIRIIIANIFALFLILLSLV